MPDRGTPQWRIESMQLINWGGFEGHHTIDLAAASTLITGGSGTGKSTLLDAYIALVMPGSVPFNGASNSNTSGRARSGDNRNVLRYMRGKLDDEREPGSGRLTEKVLRGADIPTWSAVAATWFNSDRHRFSAIRLYYAAPSAEVFEQVVKRLITVDGAFDASAFAEFARTQFDVQRIKARFTGLVNHSTYTAFSTAVCSRLGIGRSGEGQRALGLLARVQAGREFTTVDSLFKTMVLEPPKTLIDAEAAVAHFADLEATYEAMKTAEDQVKTLDGIVGLHDALQAAKAEIETIDRFGLHNPWPTPFSLWALRTEDGLLELESAAAVEAKKRAVIKAKEFGAMHQELVDRIEDLKRQQREAGGDEVDSIEQRLAATRRQLDSVRDNQAIFVENTTVLGPTPTTGEAFVALRLSGERFVADEYPARKKELDEKRWSTRDRLRELTNQRNDREAELRSLRGRTGLMQRDHHDARVMVAAAVGCNIEDLPFVAELIDMHPDFESWRTAADRAVRGFASVMLVDARRLALTRVKINDLRLQRRLNFTGVDLDGQPRDEPCDRRTLPGRLITSESPFANWVMKEIIKRFDYTCVDDPAELSKVRRGITITGQTSDGLDGAHGGTAKPIIGFSNEQRQEELRFEIAEIGHDIEELTLLETELDNSSRHIDDLRAAYVFVQATLWESIDVTGINDRCEVLQSQRDRILNANDRLAQLKKEEQELLKECDDANRQRVRAEDRLTDINETHLQLCERRDEVQVQIWQIEDAGTVRLTDDMATRLDAEFDKIATERSSKALLAVLSRISAALGEATTQARAEVKSNTEALQSKFAAFLGHWSRPDLGETVAFYDGFRDILVELKAEGLHERRARFTREVNEWSGVDLLKLHGSYIEALNEIEDRLNPINEILRHLPFGASRDRLALKRHHNESPEVAKFRRELRDLASNTTELDTDEAAAARFLTLQRFIGKLRTSERDHLIDVRRHVSFEAERVDVAGVTQNVYVSIAGKSGGESQELIAFIVGAALRYQLGDEDWPRYAPVILDEAFIKSDESFTGRAVDAWKGLGFQLVVGAPDDKVNSIERHIDRVLCVTKNARQHSHITELRDAPTIA